MAIYAESRAFVTLFHYNSSCAALMDKPVSLLTGQHSKFLEPKVIRYLTNYALATKLL